MKRVVSKVKMGGRLVRHRVRLDGDDCPVGAQVRRFQQHQLLRHVADTPDLLICGGLPFEKLAMQHDGTRWVIEAEAIENVTDPET